MLSQFGQLALLALELEIENRETEKLSLKMNTVSGAGQNVHQFLLPKNLELFCFHFFYKLVSQQSRMFPICLLLMLNTREVIYCQL